MQLPEEFCANTCEIMGEERFRRFLKAFEEEPPVSIRVNPRKCALVMGDYQPVPWCELGVYLSSRPAFTFDPLLHAGCYYVQEAASMFVHHVIKSLAVRPRTALDLCAAPGGKSTAMRAVLPDDCLLVSNEPIRQRAQVLSENIQKWGHPNCIVTNSYPRDIRKSGLMFDLILCDVPCSGEGMFRRDPDTISEWSLKNMERCAQLQREIVADAWQCLRQGGILIYSTCTFNIKENEENVLWMQQELGAKVVPVDIRPEWNITGSLLKGFHAPVYRFIPGITRSEGLFVAVTRKPGNDTEKKAGNTTREKSQLEKALKNLNIMATNSQQPTANSQIDLNYHDAISYLRRQAIVLPANAPRGLVTVGFEGHPLGMVKNIGTRANNLYPKEWAIKTTHVPESYLPVINIRPPKKQ